VIIRVLRIKYWIILRLSPKFPLRLVLTKSSKTRNLRLANQGVT